MKTVAGRSRVTAGVREGGQFSVESRAESQVTLLGAHVPANGELTLAGTSRVHDMQRDYALRETLTRPPVILADDTVAQALKKWGKYLSANTDLDPQGYADARGWVRLDPDAEEALRARSASSVSAVATAWASSDSPDATITWLDPRPSAKEGTWATRRPPHARWSVVNLARRQCADVMTSDLRDFVAAEGGDPQDIMGGFIAQALGRTGPEAAKDRPRAALSARHALREVTIYDADPPRPMWDYGSDVEAYKADLARRDAAMVRLCDDEDELRRVFGALDPSRDEEATIHAPDTYPSEFTFAEVLDSARRVRRERITRDAAARLVVERFGMAEDLYLTQQHAAGQDRHSATVWEDKKNIPATHVAAAARSTFRDHGMGHVEIDESVDLDDFRAVEREWEHLARRVPHTQAPARMAFRLTGRHRAAGVYSPAHDAIAVDPRHPSSMWHEYVHHLDHTTGAGQVSLSDDFRPILRTAQRAVSEDARFADIGKNRDYWRTPTEVLSRSAELWLHWRGVSTSLNGDDDKYDGHPGYESLYPMREQITAFFDTTFGDPT